ncbi:MAG: FAD-binding oxidoreductase [Gemmatimonadales bacterium]
MTERAAIAVIGGGVIGAGIAYHLALAGVRDVVILERADWVGTGSTGKATGGYRAQFATPINIQLSLLAREKLLRFADETGIDPGYSQVGYLWLASTESQLDALRAAQRIQKAEGLVEAMELSVSEIASVNPALSTEGLFGAAFCQTDGYIRPLSILRGYMEAAHRLGVRLKRRAECIGMRLDTEGRIKSVITQQDELHVDGVVNAAGPWAARIADMAGVSLPVVPVMRQAALTEPTDALPATMPMTIFLGSGFHARVRDGRALICWPNPVEPGEPAELRADDEWIDTVTQMAHKHIPVLRDIAIDRPACYAGLYEVSPDEHAIVGLAPQCPNMYFANGSSGHGVMHSPALGEIVADMIVGRTPTIDVSVLRPSRFDEGAAIQSLELI